MLGLNKYSSSTCNIHFNLTDHTTFASSILLECNLKCYTKGTFYNCRLEAKSDEDFDEEEVEVLLDVKS